MDDERRRRLRDSLQVEEERAWYARKALELEKAGESSNGDAPSPPVAVAPELPKIPPHKLDAQGTKVKKVDRGRRFSRHFWSPVQWCYMMERRRSSRRSSQRGKKGERGGAMEGGLQGEGSTSSGSSPGPESESGEVSSPLTPNGQFGDRPSKVLKEKHKKKSSATACCQCASLPAPRKKKSLGTESGLV